MKKSLITTIGLVTIGINSIYLSGCANAALVTTDPRSISTTTSDQYIKRDLGIAYMGNDYTNDHISVDTYNHQVLLTGQVSSYQQKNKAVNKASEMNGVKKVYDYLQVSAKYNSTTMEDTEITAQVKTKLFSTSNVNSNDVQVITSNGVVYLMGIIYKPQLKNMIEVTRSVSGVKNVVPIVQYKNSDTKTNMP
ncbi:MAG: BON domain-containing protein [Burkholderiales bacterium]|nr:BON domain-containing protein [Burkholderiales bacterium]